jgi:hypothetical protein
LVDTLASGASGRKPVEVQVLSSAPPPFPGQRPKYRSFRNQRNESNRFPTLNANQLVCRRFLKRHSRTGQHGLHPTTRPQDTPPPRPTRSRDGLPGNGVFSTLNPAPAPIKVSGNRPGAPCEYSIYGPAAKPVLQPCRHRSSNPPPTSYRHQSRPLAVSLRHDIDRKSR